MTIINEVIKGISSKLHKLTKYPVYVDVKKNHGRVSVLLSEAAGSVTGTVCW